LRVVKQFRLSSWLIFWFFVIFSSYGKAADSLATKYDLFSKYVEIGQYDSAYILGTELRSHPGIKEYSVWFYPKYTETLLKVIGDTTFEFTPKYIKSYFEEAKLKDPHNSQSYFFYEAFILDKYFKEGFAEVYPLYDAFMKLSGLTDEWILRRISDLSSLVAIKDTATILSLLDIYTELLEKYPNEEKWGDYIADLAGTPEGLLYLRRKLNILKPESSSNNWALASLLLEKEEYNEAMIYLARLVSENPDTVKYLKAMVFSAEKTNYDEKALEGYLRLIKLEPSVKEYYFNAAVLFEKKDNYAAAIKYFTKASEVAGGWGKAIFYSGLVYENSARSCGTLGFYDKCVYELAYEKYLNASGYDPEMPGLQERISQIEKYLPDTKDFEKNGYKPGDSVKINGSCYIWIEELLKVQ